MSLSIVADHIENDCVIRHLSVMSSQTQCTITDFAKNSLINLTDYKDCYVCCEKFFYDIVMANVEYAPCDLSLSCIREATNVTTDANGFNRMAPTKYIDHFVGTLSYTLNNINHSVFNVINPTDRWMKVNISDLNHMIMSLSLPATFQQDYYTVCLKFKFVK